MSTRKTPSKPRAPSLKLLAGVVQSINEGVLVAMLGFERNGLRIRHVNDAMCQLTGYQAGELVGQFHGILHPDKNVLAAMRRWHRDLASATPFAGEGQLKRRDGTCIYVAWTLTALTDSRKRPTHIVITYRDVTAHRQLQEALINSQRMDAVGRLAGGVAHDFNNLLSVINGYCEILHDSLGVKGHGRDEINAIHQAGQRATQLVRQLLAFSRQQALEPRIIDPNRLVLENVDILSRMFGEGRSLELSLSPEVNTILIDPSQMQQVLLNLCINARDATTEAGRITISTANRIVPSGLNRRATDLSPGPYVVLSVSDNGVGMEEATRRVLFEPFFTTKGEGHGTGLGLALVHGIVNQSGGHILVHSAPNQGATFEMFFPARQEAAEPARGPLVPLPQNKGHETIVLVEDDDLVRKMMTGILTTDGYEVHAFTRVAMATPKLKSLLHPVHLAIIDPLGDEAELLNMINELHQESPSLRVLFTPSRQSAPLSTLTLNRQGLLPKPFALSALLHEVRRMLDQP